MIKLKDLISEENLQSSLVPQTKSSPPNEFDVVPNSHETKNVSGQDVFVTNLRRDIIKVELKVVNGVVFVTIK